MAERCGTLGHKHFVVAFIFSGLPSHFCIEWVRQIVPKYHETLLSYSYLSNKRRVANNRRVWKEYPNLINEGSGTNGGSGIFLTAIIYTQGP